MIDSRNPIPWFGPQGFGSVPVGAVVAFAGQLGTPIPPGPPTASPPVGTTSPLEPWGWTACDGRTLKAAEYPELFAALGYLYGGSDDSFVLPDYRGYFLRGVDGGSGKDPDAAQRTAAAGGTATGIGSTQDSALLSHKHQYPQSKPAGVAHQGTDSGVPAVQSELTGIPVADDGSELTLLSEAETRPINIYVTFIIKFTAALRPTAPHRRNEGE
jgi:microcystin-dependent protein